jgi:hypothetical protein
LRSITVYDRIGLQKFRRTILLTPVEFAASKKLYAIDEDQFHIKHESEYVSRKDGKTYTVFQYAVPAVWFTRRRASGKRAAFFGEITGSSSNEVHFPGDLDHAYSLAEFLAHADGRSGGNPAGCWDGLGTWWNKAYSSDSTAQAAVLPFLKEMLENYPEIPKPYTGWYKYQD